MRTWDDERERVDELPGELRRLAANARLDDDASACEVAANELERLWRARRRHARTNLICTAALVLSMVSQAFMIMAIRSLTQALEREVVRVQPADVVPELPKGWMWIEEGGRRR